MGHLVKVNKGISKLLMLLPFNMNYLKGGTSHSKE